MRWHHDRIRHLDGLRVQFRQRSHRQCGTLVVDQLKDATFTNSMTGTGTFIKSGAGTLAVTGNSSGFTGPTNLMQGGLKVDGSLAGSQVTAFGGSALSGSGTVGSVMAQAGSTVAPGALTVRDTFQQQSGSTLAVTLFRS